MINMVSDVLSLRGAVRSGTGALSVLIALNPVAAQEPVSIEQLFALPSPDPDHQIAYGEGPHQFGKLRLPAGEGPHPVIAFFHGGCFLSQIDIQHTGAAEQAIADEGFAVWSIEYRRVGDEGGGWPGTFLDAANGLDHLRELAGPYDLDLDRVYVAGQSAGGNLALWAAARSRVPESSPVHMDDPLEIQGVLALVPAPTYAELHAANVCGGVIDGLMGGGPEDVPDRYDAVSPMRLMPVGVPQRIIVGAHDQAWGPSGLAYYEAAAAAGRSEVSFLEAPESGHFDVIYPSSSTWPLVIRELRLLTGG